MKFIASLAGLFLGLLQHNSAQAVVFVNTEPNFNFQFEIAGNFEPGATYTASFSFGGTLYLASDPLKLYNQTGDWHDIPTVSAHVSITGTPYYEYWHPTHVTSIPRCFTWECSTGTFGTFQFDENHRSMWIGAWLQAFLSANRSYGVFQMSLPDGFVAQFPGGLLPYPDHLTPIPATLPLFATGLGVLGLTAYRRRRLTLGNHQSSEKF